MPKQAKPLTDTQIRTAKPGPSDRKLFDGRGLYLLVKTNGSKLWRLKYRHGGSEKLLALGAYPDVPLAAARAACNDARALLAQGTDPSAIRAQEKTNTGNTFRAVSLQWFETTTKQRKWAPSHSSKVKGRLENHLFPYIGNTPIANVTIKNLTDCLDRIVRADKPDTVLRVRQTLSQVFRFAKRRGWLQANPAEDLGDEYRSRKLENIAAVKNPTEAGRLFLALESAKCSPVVKSALKLLALVFTRPGELRQAEWSEFRLDGPQPLWTVPARRLKKKDRGDHLVPLSQQAVAILRNLQPLSGSGTLVFPGRNPSKCISENTLNKALASLGYGTGRHTAHGFRTTASTLLNQEGSWHPDAIERQLAHLDPDRTRAAYSRGDFIEERERLMQHWARRVDELKAMAEGSNIRALPARAS